MMEKNEQDAVDLHKEFSMDTRGNRPGFFERNETDVLMTALLETMSQLWITRSRLENLENALVKNGLLSAEQIREAASNEDDRAKRDAALQNFLADAFRATRENLQSLDARQQEVDRFQSGEAE